MISLRETYIDSADISDEEELRVLLEMPLTEDERRAIRERARKAATQLETEATDLWGRMGTKLSTDARMAIARSLDQAGELRKMADALEPK